METSKVRISTFIVSLIIISLGASIFGFFLGGLNDNYGISENTNLSSFNKLTNLTKNVENIRNETEKIETKSGILDIVGDYISSAFQTAKLSFSSVKAFEEITLESSKDANLGSSAKAIRTAIISIVLVMLFLGVIISALLKKDI